jgi:hypothetical protein
LCVKRDGEQQCRGEDPKRHEDNLTPLPGDARGAFRPCGISHREV